MSLRSTIAAVGALATTALAHGTVSGFVTDGTYNGGFQLSYYYEKQNTGSFPDTASWYAEDLDNGFVDPTGYSTANINCHINAEPGALTSSVKAGGTVDFQWTTWPHGIGPVLTYVAACDGDCSAADKTALKWVKIDEAGYDTTTSTWAAQKLIDNNNTWTTTVPSNLKAGNYVFRHEIIALHGATSENGAQNYPQCMNIAVTGSGTELPEGTLGTDLYKSTDPGILFNPYTTITSYTIPGPALMSGASSGSGSGSGESAAVSTTAAAATSAATSAATTSAAAPTTTAAAPTTTAAAPATTSAAAPVVSSSTASVPTTLATLTRPAASSTTSAAQPATTSAAGTVSGTVALYGQCGGINYTGATTCASGSTCKQWNDYYYQCVSA
ncbi:glycosyl hydrolase family 61-domain-containing protein [Camillea tinctor]|nr:glycosyl hydrolase family 61-domain-containing protein [Camillea tinctor]